MQCNGLCRLANFDVGVLAGIYTKKLLNIFKVSEFVMYGKRVTLSWVEKVLITTRLEPR